MTNPVRMSPSRAATYSGCGEQYRLKYIEKVPTIPGIASLAGRAVHAIAYEQEHAKLAVIPLQVLPFADAFDCELATAEQESGLERDQFKVTGKTKARPDGDDITYWRDELGPWMCATIEKFDFGPRKIATDLPPDRNGNTIGLEYELYLPDLGWLGIIDRIEVDELGNYWVVDYKTGRPRKSTQLQEYMAALLSVGVRAVYASYFYTRTAKLAGPYPRAWTVEVFEEFVSRHQVAIADATQVGSFVPAPGDNCRWCDQADHCQFRFGSV